ncbi:capsular polysaccharide transport system permease protein [Gemmobacter megaterium]|uniref:Capsular polysaccharide transport system permease protein n=1 Tax=Gemmobacter megaterium TaxID=1086013 RepID=A0A1N7QH96_9RHOB|nr:hypothetical protein [Gemmobacter megaterium]GGE26253.1 hypothetical protein GCM10011345_35290 [Gemmobacter megaterium]SIT22144.1 capsular polysaccharide transport system permease protein [Gemmobacter megaterium]
MAKTPRTPAEARLRKRNRRAADPADDSEAEGTRGGKGRRKLDGLGSRALNRLRQKTGRRRKQAEETPETEAEAQAGAADAPVPPPGVPSPADLPQGPAPSLPGVRPEAAPGVVPAAPDAGPLPGPAAPVPRSGPPLPALVRRSFVARPAGRLALQAAPLAGRDRPAPPARPDPLPAARPQRRHRIMLWSFLVLVLLPFALSGLYLWAVARDQYASTVAFSVRKEEAQSSFDIIGGITQLAGSSTSDSDILYEFIRSQDMVSRVDADLNLRAMWARAWPADPVFAYDPSGTIEDLHAHWLRKVKLSYDGGTGIITVRALAFDAGDADRIATAIYAESSRMVNALSEEARADATRHAREERELAFERLKEARQALTTFRLRTQIVDIDSDLQGQMGLLNTLQAQLAAVLIELDLLNETAQPGDLRIRQAERRIEVIETRIAAERAKFGEGGKGPGGEDYARIAAEFERLKVELEFAEATYNSAQSSYDSALSNAQRQSRYLAAHIRPTVAEQALYPQRVILFALTGFFLLVFWSVGVLVYYSVRDRR